MRLDTGCVVPRTPVGLARTPVGLARTPVGLARPPVDLARPQIVVGLARTLNDLHLSHVMARRRLDKCT